MFLLYYHRLWCPVCYEGSLCRFALLDSIMWLSYLHDLFLLILVCPHTRVLCLLLLLLLLTKLNRITTITLHVDPHDLSAHATNSERMTFSYACRIGLYVYLEHRGGCSQVFMYSLYMPTDYVGVTEYVKSLCKKNRRAALPKTFGKRFLWIFLTSRDLIFVPEKPTGIVFWKVFPSSALQIYAASKKNKMHGINIHGDSSFMSCKPTIFHIMKYVFTKVHRFELLFVLSMGYM